MAAAHTFFQANPDHVEMKQNLDYYRMMAGVQKEDFKDLEARPHMVRANLLSDESFTVFVLSHSWLISGGGLIIMTNFNCCPEEKIFI